MTSKYANWREWLEALRAQPWMAESDHAADLLRLLDRLEHIAQTYDDLFDVLRDAGHRDTWNDGFDLPARVEHIAQSDRDLRNLCQSAGLINDRDETTDVVPLLRMFLPV